MFWIIYFITVVYWHVFEVISAHAFLNLFLCLFVFFPIPENIYKKHLITIIKNSLGVILGAVLLWHESYLPPVLTLWNFLIDPELRPSSTFLWRFFLSEINIKIFIFAVPTIIFSYILSRTKFKKYFGAFFLICFLIIGFTEKTSVTGDLFGNFYENESKKVVKFIDNPNNDFDIVILQLCSFAWADFNEVDYNLRQFFNKFDYIFTDFNSATSYSNPAVIRLLRSTCGQSTETKLFAEANKSCYLLEGLRGVGYTPYTLLNHDGIYAGFNQEIIKYGKAPQPLNNSELKLIQTNFDGAPTYSDKDSLLFWLDSRKKDPSLKTVLVYNSTTLHTGSRYIESPYLASHEQYSLALKNIISDLDSFFVDLKKSNKNTIVIIVGEHGAALKGSTIQPGTVREIPLPSITKTPVAIKLFGPNFNNEDGGEPILVNQPTSYFAIAELLEKIIEVSPTDKAQLPSIEFSPEAYPEFVSENETGFVVKTKLGLFYRLKKYKTWDIIPSSIEPRSQNYFK